MNDELKRTVRLKRPSRSAVDDDGQTVWEGPEVDTDFELLSTQRLMQILAEGDEQRRRLEAVADNDEDGVVAQRAGSDAFEIIARDDLTAAIQSTEVADEDAIVAGEPLAEEVDPDAPATSLVSTMALRRILNEDGEAELAPADEDAQIMRDAGFDPRGKR